MNLRAKINFALFGMSVQMAFIMALVHHWSCLVWAVLTVVYWNIGEYWIKKEKEKNNA